MSRTVDELTDILGDTSWDVFEGLYSGDLFVRMEKGLLGFYMRVGTHFKRPMQVIIADGNFIRMRSANQWAEFPLIEINANEPEACVYPDGTTTKPTWQPYLSYAQYAAGNAAGNTVYVSSSCIPTTTTYTINNTHASNHTPNQLALIQQAQIQAAQAQMQAQYARLQNPQQTSGQVAGYGGILGSLLGVK